MSFFQDQLGAKDCVVSAVEYLKYIYLAYLSKPAADRAIYRHVREHKPRAIVEIGVGQASRTERMLQLLLRDVAAADVRYTGIDMFEARPAESPGLALKQAHAQLKSFGVKVQLVPGDPAMALARAANGLKNTDLLIISHDQDPASLAKAWTFVPRMLHPGSHVFLETADAAGGPTRFVPLSMAEIEQRVTENSKATRRAA